MKNLLLALFGLLCLVAAALLSPARGQDVAAHAAVGVFCQTLEGQKESCSVARRAGPAFEDQESCQAAILNDAEKIEKELKETKDLPKGVYVVTLMCAHEGQETFRKEIKVIVGTAA